MKIREVEVFPFRLPLRRDFRWTGLQRQLGGFVFVRIRCDDGSEGYGEATPLPDWGGDFDRRGGETQQTVVTIVRDVIAPLLIGRDPREIRATHAAIASAVRGHTYARCAVDIALHDLAAKSAGLPLHGLLGGAARDRVAVAHMIGLMPEGEAIAEAECAVADGITALQVKGGVDGERDIRLIAELRRRLGDAVSLRLDANQGYKRAKAARRIIERLAQAGVTSVEQPVIGVDEMQCSTTTSPVPIIADESCWNAVDVLELWRSRAVDAVSIYLAKAGGVAAAMQVSAVAEAAGFAADINGSIESGIGNAANLHVAIAAGAVTLPAVIPVSAPAGRHPWKVAGRYFEDDVVTEPFPVAAGALLPLFGPGLGIIIDEERLQRYRED
jgi:muconate cycloisomerase